MYTVQGQRRDCCQWTKAAVAVFVTRYSFCGRLVRSCTFNVFVKSLTLSILTKTQNKLSYSTVRVFGPKRDEATGEWRRLHNEELNDLYSSPNIIRVINREG
jgi:hypothetical protein